MPQSDILTLPVAHETHTMRFQPCLFLECNTCLASAKHNKDELMRPCPGKLVLPPW